MRKRGAYKKVLKHYVLSDEQQRGRVCVLECKHAVTITHSDVPSMTYCYLCTKDREQAASNLRSAATSLEAIAVASVEKRIEELVEKRVIAALEKLTQPPNDSIPPAPDLTKKETQQ